MTVRLAHPVPALGAGSVHVWRVALRGHWPTPELHATLSADERQRAASFIFGDDRDRYIVAHGMLRAILASYVGRGPDELEFVAGEFGKPSLLGADGLEFNLSHSRDVALIAVTRGAAMGIDIEHWDDRGDYLEIAEHFFSPAERAALHACNSVREGFFTLWARKEAYIKATGHGVSRGLEHFDVSIELDAPRLIADRVQPEWVNEWSFRSLDAGDERSAAVVLRGQISELHWFDAQRCFERTPQELGT